MVLMSTSAIWLEEMAPIAPLHSVQKTEMRST